MATLKQYDIEAKDLGKVEIEDELLKVKTNQQMVKDYITALRANIRQWSANTKNRREVKATGTKPHPQKGTGRARQGEITAPHYRGGGIVFGPKPKFDQKIRINKKERRAAIKSLICERILEDKAIVLKFDEKSISKTKQVAGFLKKLKLLGKRVYIVAEEPKDILGKYDGFISSLRNIPKVEFVYGPNMNGYELALSQEVIFLEPAMDYIKTILGKVSKK